MTRSAMREVRNPVLCLPAIRELLTDNPSAAIALRPILLDIAAAARLKAEHCWSKHKAPMAAYWKAVSVYARHIARALKELG